MKKNLQEQNFAGCYVGQAENDLNSTLTKVVQYQQFDGKQVAIPRTDLYRHIEANSHQLRSVLHKMREADVDPELREIIWMLADKADALTKMIRHI